jgi:hypothetical protein
MMFHLILAVAQKMDLMKLPEYVPEKRKMSTSCISSCFDPSSCPLSSSALLYCTSSALRLFGLTLFRLFWSFFWAPVTATQVRRAGQPVA